MKKNFIFWDCECQTIFFFFNDVLAETESTTVTADFPNPPDSFYFFLNLALFFLNVGVWVKST